MPSWAPYGSDRRFALKLLRRAITSPRQTIHRVNPENVLSWWRYRRQWMHCNICGHQGTILYEMPDLVTFRLHRISPIREALRCRGCGSSMRNRTVAEGLLEFMRHDFGTDVSTIDELSRVFPESVQVLDTDANSHIAKRLAHAPGYLASLYVEDQDSGADLGSGVINVDLTRMPFADRSFDLVITSEVMEHVRFLDRAHREIARCLRLTGRYIFTVPYDPTLARTWRLIDEETDEQLAEPPHIHGDPFMRDAGIKSYRVFGSDIATTMEASGLKATFSLVDRPDLGIFQGDLFEATLI